jgi:hypothetical protein
MKTAILFVLLGAKMAQASELLYDNTTTDTFNTVFYSSGYDALGDQIQLVSPGIANGASVEFYNQGGAGTFDAELSLYNLGSPVGSLIGSSTVTGISTVGSDVIDVNFDLSSVTVPQDLVFAVSLNNVSQGVDPGLDLFEPPAVGSSDPTFMIASSGAGFFELPAPASETTDLYFQLVGDAGEISPEPSTMGLIGMGLIAAVIAGWVRRAEKSHD